MFLVDTLVGRIGGDSVSVLIYCPQSTGVWWWCVCVCVVCVVVVTAGEVGVSADRAQERIHATQDV